MSKTLTVTINNDNADETYQESLSVNLTNPPIVTQGTTPPATITITDNDAAPTVSITSATVDEAAGTATLTVSLSRLSERSPQIAWATANGTAVAAGDYTAANGTLTFGATELSKTFTVTINDDNVDEADQESLSVSLTNPPIVTQGTTPPATITITDNDAAPTVSITNATVDEGAGTATLTVSLSRPSQRSPQIAWATANGTAVAPGDYTAANGTLTFGATELSKTLTVTISNDNVDEADQESLAVNLTNPAIVTQGTTPPATITITDNDAAPTVSITNATVDEGAGTAALTVSLSRPSERSPQIGWATANGTAVAPGDYTAASGALTFGATELSKTLTVTINNDNVDEADQESFAVNLTNPPIVTQGTTPPATITITDNDAAPTVSITNATVDEAAGTATLTVNLSRPSERSPQIAWATANGTAVAPGDYSAASGTLTFGATELSKTFTVTINNDNVDEADQESLSVNLINPLIVTQGSTPPATITITDNDAAPTVSITSATVDEAAGTATLTVSLSRLSERSPQIGWATANGTAAARRLQRGQRDADLRGDGVEQDAHGHNQQRQRRRGRSGIVRREPDQSGDCDPRHHAARDHHDHGQ